MIDWHLVGDINKIKSLKYMKNNGKTTRIWILRNNWTALSGHANQRNFNNMLWLPQTLKKIRIILQEFWKPGEKAKVKEYLSLQASIRIWGDMLGSMKVVLHHILLQKSEDKQYKKVK